MRRAPAPPASLSGPGYYNALDATDAVPRLTMPVCFLAAEGEGQSAQDAGDLHEPAGKSRGEKLEMVSGAAHGNDIPLEQPAVWDKVKSFLARHR
jgi:hypothetical protein